MNGIIVATSRGGFGASQTGACAPVLFAAGLFLLLIAAYLCRSGRVMR